MLHTVEAMIDPQGHVTWLEDIKLQKSQRVLITLLDTPIVDEALLMAEPSLAADWLNDEEEAAWKHLQADK